MTEEELENITLSITPFDSEIVGVMDDFVYFRESIYKYLEGDEKEEFCCIRMKKAQYLQMIDLWLEQKQDFCKRYDHFCGVFGNFHIEEYKELGTINLLVDFDENKGEDGEYIYKDVSLFEVISFDAHCDMEHG